MRITLVALAIFFIWALWAENNDINDRFDEIEERIDEIETATLVDRLNFSADFRFTLNNFFFKDNSAGDVKDYGFINKDGNNLLFANLRGRIKFMSYLGDKKNIKLVGWLTAYKNFLDSAPGDFEDVTFITYDLSRGYVPEDGRVYLERLYVDWFFSKYWDLTVGRTPSTDGIPYGLKVNNVPLGSFFESFSNFPCDGIYLTYNLGRFSLPTSFFRFGTVTRSYMDRTFTTAPLIQADDQGLQIYFLTGFDIEIPSLPGDRISLTYAITPEMKASRVKLPDGSFTNPPENLGMFSQTALGLRLVNIFYTGIDFYGSVNWSRIVPGTRSEDNPDSGSISITTDDGKTYPLYTALGNPLDGKAMDGFLYYIGTRYTTPIRVAHDNIKIGIDFNYADKNYTWFYVPDTTGLPRFAIRGYYAEAYLIIPIERKASFKLGGYKAHLNYPTGIFFPAGQGLPKIDETIYNAYLMLNAYF